MIVTTAKPLPKMPNIDLKWKSFNLRYQWGPELKLLSTSSGDSNSRNTPLVKLEGVAAFR